MKKTLFFLSAALVLASCAPDTNDNLKPEIPEGDLVFAASIAEGDDGRVSVTDGVSTWKAEDQIGVFSLDAEGAVLSTNVPYTTAVGGSTVTFEADETHVTKGATYYAMSPYFEGHPNKLNATGDLTTEIAQGDAISDYKFAPWAANSVQIFTPTEDGLTTSNNPYYLYGSGVAPTEGNKVQMTFHHVLPILEIGLLGVDEVKQIRLQTATKDDGYAQAENKFLNAKGFVNLATGEITTSNISSTGHRVDGKFKDDATVQLNTTTPLRLKFVVGRFECKDGLNVTITLADGSTITKEIWDGKTVAMYDAEKGNKHIYQPIVVPYVTATAPAEFAVEGGVATITPESSSAWTVTDKPEWISVSPASGAAGESFVATAEASTAAARTGNIVVTNEDGVSVSIPVSQAEYVAVAADYYSVVVNDIDWAASYVHHVKNAESQTIATITKEYLGATQNKQVIVVYKGTNLASGQTLDGGSVSVPDMVPANVAYTAGSGTDAAVVYIKNDGSEISFTEQAGASTATVAPYVLTSNSNVKSHATVKIGSKIWLAEDFCTTKYVDGTDITSAVAGDAWTDTDARVFINGDKYLYNGFAIGYSASGCDYSNFAPVGWKLISNDDWEALRLWVNKSNSTLTEVALFGNTSNYKAAASSSKVKFSALGYTNTWGGTPVSETQGYMLMTKKNEDMYGEDGKHYSKQAFKTGFSVRLVQE